jgi:hypothetical protein
MELNNIVAKNSYKVLKLIKMLNLFSVTFFFFALSCIQ